MKDIVYEIQKLKESRNAVILAHYYQEDEVQEIADFIGDSLDLSRKAAATNTDVIVFCGVVFMAEVAKILNPKKIVLIPDLNAGCSLEQSCKAQDLKNFKLKHSDHEVILYINSSAASKAVADVIVTSANVEKIINSIPKDKGIIFAPDRHMGKYLINKTGREMLLWHGSCIVHERFSEKDLVRLKILHPQSRVIAHPECPENILAYAEHIGSTSSMIEYTKKLPGEEFIVLTEPGILRQMKKESPSSIFYSVAGNDDAGCTLCSTCPFMRLNTLEKVLLSLKTLHFEVKLSDELIEAARKPLDRMLLF